MSNAPERFNCAACVNGNHCDESGAWPGSRGPHEREFLVIKSRDKKRVLYTSRVCLLPLVGDVEATWLRLFDHYREGHLYQAGGVMDQPHKYIEAMELIKAHTG